MTQGVVCHEVMQAVENRNQGKRNSFATDKLPHMMRKQLCYLSIRVVDVESRACGFHRTGVAMYVLENTLVFNWKLKGQEFTIKEKTSVEKVLPLFRMNKRKNF